MEFVNVGALLLDGVTTPNSSESDHSDNDSFYLKEPAEKKNSGFYFVNHDPPPLRTYVPLHVDTTPLKAYITSLFYPEVYMKVFYAARLTFMVALPLSLLARIPRMMKIFPFHVVIPLFGIVDSRYRTGEQIAGCIMSCQAALFFLVYGTLLNVWNTLDHPSAWWCSVIFGVFVVSLFGDVRSKRYLCLFTALIVGMQHSPGGTRIINPALCARDVVMASGFALLQVFVPPRTNAREADDIMRGVWQHIIRIMKSATVACWSEDPIECTLALSNMATEPIQNALAEMPMKLNFVMYEPWVTTLQLQLRRERVELLQNFRPRIHALTDTARTTVMKRPFRLQQKADPGTVIDTEELLLGKAARRGKSRRAARREEESMPYGRSASDLPDDHLPYGEGKDTKKNTTVTFEEDKKSDDEGENPYYRSVRRSVSRVFGVKGTDAEEERDENPLGKPIRRRSGKSDGSSCRSAEGGDDKSLVAWRKSKRITEEPLRNFIRAFEDTASALGKHLNPKDVAANVPFDELQEASSDLRTAINKIHFEYLIKGDHPVNPVRYNNTIFIHLSLIAMADRVIAYGERMRNFDRSKYKSQWRRIWEFCFYDHWSRFWEDLPKRLTLATPRDVRIVKDAIKMACAYGVGVMFTQYMDPEHAYYFGMAILMGVGWPTAGDTMVASVYRITGMVCASAIAYVAVWHTNNLSGELAIALAGVFISLLFRDVMPYAHTAQYCSMLIITSLNSAGTKLVLLSRIVSNAFTVMAYYVICVFMFPIDVLKVTYSYQMKSCLFITSQFTQLVRIMNVPLNCADPERREALMAELRVLDRSRREGFQIIATFGMWMHKAIMEPTARGLPYPLQEMKSVYSSLRRLSSATDMMFVALFQLYTPRANPVDESIATQIRLITPVMRKIDVKMRVVMQDFIDAMATPLQWTPEGATRHFSDFLALSKDLHDVFNTQSRRSIEALREEFRNSVMNRTFARAAQSNIIPTPPITGNNFAVPFSQNNSFFPPGRNTSFIPANTSFAKVSTDGVATTLQGKDLEEALDPIERAAEEEAYTDFIGARPTAVDDDASTTTHPLSTNDTAVPIGDAPLQTQVSFVDSDPRGGVSFVGIPPVRFSVENDMEMVLSIIVASEIFFGEAERLLRTMYNINLYARSRDGPPKLESPFEV